MFRSKNTTYGNRFFVRYYDGNGRSNWIYSFKGFPEYEGLGPDVWSYRSLTEAEVIDTAKAALVQVQPKA